MSTSLIILCTIIPIFICAFMARGRNRSGVKGALVGFFTGWIGVLVMFFFLKKRNAKGYLV